MLVHTYFYNSTQVTKSEMHVINELHRNVTTRWKCEQNKWINISSEFGRQFENLRNKTTTIANVPNIFYSP